MWPHLHVILYNIHTVVCYVYTANCYNIFPSQLQLLHSYCSPNRSILLIQLIYLSFSTVYLVIGILPCLSWLFLPVAASLGLSASAYFCLTTSVFVCNYLILRGCMSQSVFLDFFSISDSLCMLWFVCTELFCLRVCQYSAHVSVSVLVSMFVFVCRCLFVPVELSLSSVLLSL